MEFNHTDLPESRLQERLIELCNNKRRIGYTGIRLAQVTHEIDLISFELSERAREQYGIEIEEAWGEYGA